MPRLNAAAFVIPLICLGGCQPSPTAPAVVATSEATHLGTGIRPTTTPEANETELQALTTRLAMLEASPTLSALNEQEVARLRALIAALTGELLAGGAAGGDAQGASFATIQTTVFDRTCVSHHGAFADAGLDLRSPQSYDNLVNVNSTQTDLVLVKPGDPEASYLLHKLDGRATIVGDRMPTGGPFLTDDQTEMVRSWIAAGAPNN